MTQRSPSEEQRGEDILDALLSTAFADDPELDSSSSRAARAKLPERPTIIGPYAVLDVLGAGGVASVWRVFDGELERELAVKLLRPELRDDAEMRRRLEEEARISSRLDHPGIVSVHARGRIEDGRPYFAMRLVEGQTLAEIFAARSDGDARARLEILEKVASALAHAHQRRIVHGDVKPQNVMVGAFGEVQLMDWGFAFELDTPENDPRAGKRRIGGTPAYMSPEQARGTRSAISPRTDVFGLGAILCEMLTGAPPYRATTKREVVAQATLPALDDARARLSSCGAGAALVDLALRCLAEEPEQRPADAGFVARALGIYLSDLETRARDLEIEAAKAHARAEQEARARRLGYALAITLAGVSVIASVLWIAFENRRAEREETTRSGLAGLLEHAETLHEQARLDPLGEHDLWERSIAAAHEAETWLRARESSSSQRLEASELIARTEAESAAAKRDRRIRDRILALRTELVDDGQIFAAEQRYSELFQELGLDVDAKDPAPARAVIQASPIRVHLIQTLDAWMHLRKRTGKPDPEAWKRMLALARSLDSDPLRESLRMAYAERDVEKFLALIAPPLDLSRFPARSHDLVASCLRELGRPQDAIDFLRRALAVYPGDANLSHSLASYLGLHQKKQPPLEEMERLLWMAHAVRPRDAHLICDLARVLYLRKRYDEMIQVLAQTKGLEPADLRSEYFLGLALFGKGDIESSERVFVASCAKGSPSSAIALAEGCVRRGCTAAALHYAELAARYGAKPLELDLLLAPIYVDARDTEKAIAAATRAIHVDPENPDPRKSLIVAHVKVGRVAAAQDLLDRWRTAMESEEVPTIDLSGFESDIDLASGLIARLDEDGEQLLGGRIETKIDFGACASRYERVELGYDLLSAAIAEDADHLPVFAYSEAARCAWTLAQQETGDATRAAALRHEALLWMQAELRFLRTPGVNDPEHGHELRLLVSSFLVDPLWQGARDGTVVEDAAEREAWRAFFADVTVEVEKLGCAIR